jgi:hypothetical protein
VEDLHIVEMEEVGVSEAGEVAVEVGAVGEDEAAHEAVEVLSSLRGVSHDIYDDGLYDARD